MHKTMTEEELMVHPEISSEDKKLIKETVGLISDPTACPDGLRGYLVTLFEENEVDDQFRSELGGAAASFVDGWSYCLEYGNVKGES
jgi:hypothetical protein